MGDKQIQNNGQAYTDWHTQIFMSNEIKLIDNWSNKRETLRHRVQLEPANNSLMK
jgi:hypothetical protein